MKTTSKLALATGVVAILGACTHSPIPVAENFQLTAQKKVRSAGHWEILSRDVVGQTTQRLASAGVNKNTSLFVHLPANPTVFDRAFNDFLITELVNSGYGVVSEPSPSAVSISYKTQLVRHQSARPHFVPGAVTALTAGLYVAHGLAVHATTGEAMAGALGFAALADMGAGQFTGGPTSHELVLTTTVESQKRFLVRKTDVYYIESADASLFTPQTLQPTQLKVVSQ
jgi:hypothetical protein